MIVRVMLSTMSDCIVVINVRVPESGVFVNISGED